MIWHAQAINGLEPLTGKVLWSIGLEPLYGMSIMSPRQHGDKLFAAGIGGAGAVLKLEGDKVTTIWQETTAKEKGFAVKPRGFTRSTPLPSSKETSFTAPISPVCFAPSNSTPARNSGSPSSR